MFSSNINVIMFGKAFLRYSFEYPSLGAHNPRALGLRL